MLGFANVAAGRINGAAALTGFMIIRKYMGVSPGQKGP